MNAEGGQFNNQFGQVLELAYWNEAAGARYAWFRSERPGNAPVGKYHTELVKLAKASLMEGDGSFVPAPGVEEPQWMSDVSLKLGVDLDFQHTKIPATGEITEESLFKNRHSWQRDKWGHWRLPFVSSSYRPALVGRVCIRWCSLADTFDQLSSPVKAYLEWMHAGRPEFQGDNSRFGTLSMRRSLIIAAENQLPYEAAAPYMDVLGQLDSTNTHHRTIHESVELALRATLLNKPPAKQTTNARQKSKASSPKIQQSLTVQAVEALDARDFLSANWWMRVGISACGTIAVPALLPMVHEKLTGDDGSDLLADLPPDRAQALIKTYLTTLINAYAQDKSRDKKTRKIQKTIIDSRGTVDLMQLVALAKGIMKTEDSALEPHERRPLLNPRSMYGVGDALLVVLEYTRPVEAADEQWGAQFDQDVLHAEIIDTLHARLSHGRTKAVKETMAQNSLRLRYPFASDKTLDTIRGQLTSGQAPAKVRARFRRRQQGVVSRNVRQPGRGFLS